MTAKPSERSKGISYPIRELTIPAAKLEKKGIKVIKLNVGDPCAYDFDTPNFIKDAVKKALDEGWNAYSPSEGYGELIDAVLERERRKNGVVYDPGNVCITAGTTEAIQNLYFSLVNPGDEVLLPDPCYPLYLSALPLVEGKPVFYKLDEEKGWLPDLDDIEKRISRKTKMAVIINPNNPTGAVYDRKHLERIFEVMARHKNLIVVSDEIYDELTFEGEHVSLASVSGEIPLVTFNGMSKTCLATGWRIGWAMFRGEGIDDVRDAYLRLARARLCANSICQRGAIASLLKPREYLKEVNRVLKKRKEYCVKRVRDIEGLSSTVPRGAFYIFPRIDSLAENKQSPWKTDKEFVLDLLNEGHVLVVNGSGFGRENAQGHFRSVILPPIETLEEAFNSVETFMKRRMKRRVA